MGTTYPVTPPSSAYGKGVNYPVYFISWNDIVGTGGGAGYTINGVTYYKDGFCYKLSKLTGGGEQFRLPTEAEWEYAAKGGQETHNYTYSGNNSIGNVAWYYSNSSNRTHSVGGRQTNELSVYDMTGNVWEWCSDWHGSSYPSGSYNPVGASSGTSRIFRGGSWEDDTRYCSVSYREDFAPTLRHYTIGFRLALSPSSTGIDVVEEDVLKVYPSPVSGVLYIESEQLNARIEIFDISGRVVISDVQSTVNNSIYVGALPAGIYILRVGNRTTKFVKK
jgi:hypothetical protein